MSMTTSSSESANYTRERRPRRHAGVSVTAMGWASMLLLVSGVSAFGNVPSRIPDSIDSRRTFTGTSTGKIFGNSETRWSTTNVQQRSLSDPSRITSTAPVFSSTQLHYSNENEDQGDQEKQTRSKVGLNLWRRNEPDVVDEKQQQVDQYLKWLDQRYHRMHDDEVVQANPKFSVMGWLKGGEGQEISAEKAQSDALYALGVAELASNRLLQQHHLPPKSFIDASASQTMEAVSEGSNPEVLEKSAVVEAGAAVLNRMRNRRQALLRYQNKKLIDALKFTLNALTNAPRTAMKLWKMGGGSKTLAMTLSMTAAFMIIARPLMQAFARDTADTALLAMGK